MKNLLFAFFVFLSFSAIAQFETVVPLPAEEVPESVVAPIAEQSAAFPINFVKVHVLPGKTKRHKNPYDGDGCRVLFPDGRVVKIRFASIDAPEMSNSFTGVDTIQPYAIQSRNLLNSLIGDKDIYLDTLPFKGTKSKWSYDRMLADPYNVSDSSLITFTLVHEGAAWFSASSSRDTRIDPSIDALLSETHIGAKSRFVGLWGKRKVKSPMYWKRTYRNHGKPPAK